MQGGCHFWRHADYPLEPHDAETGVPVTAGVPHLQDDRSDRLCRYTGRGCGGAQGREEVS